ncbi:hypothetical protein BHK98_01840 [Hornefia porci]|uniref:Uncharacterized protein n=1 Tax=Hornefia porci TaxID=2652292 RepID=A0A1Q9JFB5_9FIRM|nr:hypothetical protein [Hornefia porci]OLR54930.1 hypothetical protein BHK98_01840 [Hornefia porci]
MSRIFKRSVFITIVTCFVLLLLFTVGAVKAHAEVAFKDLPAEGVVFDVIEGDGGFVDYDSCIELKITDDGEQITSFESSDENIAYASYDVYGSQNRIIIYPVAPGTCTVTAYGADGGKLSFPVTVKEAYIKVKLMYSSHMDTFYYGTRKIYVETLPGAKITLKAGKDKYKAVKANKLGSACVKLKKTYKLKTKVSAVVNYKGISVTLKDKVKSGTEFFDVRATKKSPKKLKVRIDNPHKGDVVYVKYKGRTYSVKVRKNYDRHQKIFTFKLKKALKKNSRLTVWIVNKDKKTLEKKTSFKLSNWYYTKYPDDDNNIEEDSEDE